MMKKKMFAFVLIAALLLSIFPASVFAAEIVDSGTCGENLTWTLDSEGVLTISGTGDMDDHNSYIGPVPGWDGKRWEVTKVVIEDGVTSIGDCTFFDHVNMAEISIPNSVTRIGNDAFMGCRFAEITLPNSVQWIGDNAFYYCTHLAELSLPDDLVHIGAGAFTSCYGLTEITIPKNVAEIGMAAFNRCDGLKEIRVDRGNSRYYSDDSGVLYDRSEAALVQCPVGFEGDYTIAKGVKKISSSAFFECEQLSGISIPESVETIERYAFTGCSGLKEVVIPFGVREIGEYAFNGCHNLAQISIPSSVKIIGREAFAATGVAENEANWDGDVLYIDGFLVQANRKLAGVYEIKEGTRGIATGVFEECQELAGVKVPASVQAVSPEAFRAGDAFTFIDVAEKNPAYCSDSSGVLYNKNKTELLQCPGGFSGSYQIPESVTTIGDSAFIDCEGLTEIRIGSKVRTIGQEAFSSCGQLETVTIPDGVTTIGRAAFEDCSSLKNVVVGNGVREIGAFAFSENVKLSEVRLGDHIESIGQRAFFSCPITTITLPRTLKEIGPGAFRFTDLETACYLGTEADRAKITIGISNEELLDAEWSYSPAAAPEFGDVEQGKFYYDAVQWAVAEGVTSGKTPTSFAPDESCTRAQVVTFLWRANGSPKPTGTDNPFADVKPGQFYTDAVLWAVENGITAGVDATHFKPDAKVSRAQFVTFLYRAKGKPAATGTNPFKDVQAGQFYTDAVTWAVENDITAGLDATTFGVNNRCTRGQVVTFLYRAYQ